MDKQELSLVWVTVFLKFILPAILISVAVYAGFTDSLFTALISSPIFIIPLVLFGALKRVWIDEQNLYVSNFLKTITIPFSQICCAKRDCYDRYRVVVIKLKTQSEFRREIVFVPKSVSPRDWLTDPLGQFLKKFPEHEL